MIVFNNQEKIFYSDRIVFEHGFTTRLSEVDKNFAEYLITKKNARLIFTPEQIHADGVMRVGEQRQGSEEIIASADALIYIKNNKSKACLYIRTADCIPIILASKKGVVAVVHSGWRGGWLNIVGKTAKKLLEATAADQLLACIGPGIGECCYVIDEKRAQLFKEKYRQWEGEIISNTANEPHLNLLKLVYLQLVEAGIKAENIDWKNFCTCCQKDLFYSYRQSKGKLAGEMFSFICL